MHHVNTGKLRHRVRRLWWNDHLCGHLQRANTVKLRLSMRQLWRNNHLCGHLQRRHAVEPRRCMRQQLWWRNDNLCGLQRHAGELRDGLLGLLLW
jgi:hypothetical protein